MKKLMFSILLAVALLVPAASAGTLALDISGPYGFLSTDGNWSLGWQFTVSSPVTVDGLAYFNNAGDTENHDVGIFNDTTQALLISTTVLPTDPQIGTATWRVHGVTPYFLGVGTYDIMAVTGSGVYAATPTTLSTFLPPITFIQDEFFTPPGGVLAFPNDTDGAEVQGIFGPSFTITTGIPEPASILLIGGGLLALAGLRRRRA
jgi:hypothetical protein